MFTKCNNSSACNTPRKLKTATSPAVLHMITPTTVTDFETNTNNTVLQQTNEYKNISQKLFNDTSTPQSYSVSQNKMADLGCHPIDQQRQSSNDSNTAKEKMSPAIRILRRSDNVNYSNAETRQQRCNSTPRREKCDLFDRLSIGQNSSTPKHSRHSTFGSHDNSDIFSTPPNRSYDRSFNMSDGSHKNNSSPNILTLGDFFPDTAKASQTSKRRITPINENNQANYRRKNVFNNTTNNSFEHHRSSTTEHIKPKRRVVPTTISHSPSNQYDNIVSSSFKSENNLANIMAAQPELSCNTNIDRQLLINEKSRVKKDFVDLEIPVHELNARLRHDCNLAFKLDDSSSKKKGSVVYDASKVTNESILNRLIDIYSVIINENLTQNFLTEIAFLINLLNADDPSFIDETGIVLAKLQRSRSISCNEQSELSLLINNQPNYYHVLHNNIHNCVYFAFGALKRQQHLLVLLDATSIKVLLDNERLITLSSEIVTLLADVHAFKIRLEMKRANQLTTPIKLENNIKSVMYQQDNDTRRYFSSDNEFAAFRRQRDGFYEILRLWEQKHIAPNFNFNNDLAKNVQNLMNIMQHPINMAHLAKLFTSQLIISCNFDDTTANELQIALPGIDINKLTKLQHRLIAPGDFSTEFLFPGNQIFFRDFITSAGSYIFLEQLKICLISELMDMNKMATFDEQQTFNINQENEFNCNKNSYELIVRPEIITTMRILAKFTGFIIDYSNCYDGIRNPDVDDHQIILRNFINPIFDIKLILIDSIKDKRLVITIPWIVQYLAMLDSITLRLNYYNELFEILYTIYIELNLKQLSNNNNCNYFNYMRPTSIFIIKLCLGWLFDLPNVPNHFYKHLQKLSNQQITDNNNNLLKSLINSSYQNNKRVKNELNINNDDDDNACDNLDSKNNLILNSINKLLDPILEGVLTAACPFLADFRVAIMPQRTGKTVSRTGRYRHITTKLTTISIINTKHNNYHNDNIINKNNINNNQLRLIESFLQSQSQSTRRTVDFIIERATSAVIKDFQIEHLLVIKSETKCFIKNLKSPINKTKLLNIYKNGLNLIEKKWSEVIPKMIKKRVEIAFEALLPNEMLKSVKEMCILIAITRCRLKTNEWRLSHLNNYEIFDKNIYNNKSHTNDESISISNSSNTLNNNINEQQSTIIRLDFHNTTTVPSNVLYKLQELLHQSSMLSQQLDINKIFNYCDEFLLCINEHEQLSATYYRNAAFMLLHLSLLLVENRPDLLTDELIEILSTIWKHKKLIEFTVPIGNEINQKTPTRTALLGLSSDESLMDEQREQPQSQRIFSKPYIFYNLLNPRLMTLLQNKSINSFNRLAKLLSKLIIEKLLNIDLFNEQCVTLFNCEWPEHTLKMLSYLFKTISSIIDKDLFSKEQKQSYLFLEMLSDLASNMEEF